MFVDTLAQHVVDVMNNEISEQLLDDWNNSNLDEGQDYAEFKFMEFASDDLKKQYNEYYGYVEGDDYFLC
jgi:hypothetical protein